MTTIAKYLPKKERLLSLSFIFLLFLSSCTVKEVEITNIKNVSAKNITKKGIDFHLDIGINNPNNFSFTVQRVKANLYANNIYVGKINNPENFRVLKNSTETYPIDFHLDFKSLKDNYLQVFKTIISRKANIRIKGYVKVKKFIFSKKVYFDKETPYKFLRLGN